MKFCKAKIVYLKEHLNQFLLIFTKTFKELSMISTLLKKKQKSIYPRKIANMCTFLLFKILMKSSIKALLFHIATTSGRFLNSRTKKVQKF